MTAAHLDSSSYARQLADEYDDLIRRHADDNGVLPDHLAVQAAELGHRLFLLHSEEADHYYRLSKEHREGRRTR